MLALSQTPVASLGLETETSAEQVALHQLAVAFWLVFYASEALEMTWTTQLRRHGMIISKVSCCWNRTCGMLTFQIWVSLFPSFQFLCRGRTKPQLLKQSLSAFIKQAQEGRGSLWGRSATPHQGSLYSSICLHIHRTRIHGYRSRWF